MIVPIDHNPCAKLVYLFWRLVGMVLASLGCVTNVVNPASRIWWEKGGKTGSRKAEPVMHGHLLLVRDV